MILELVVHDLLLITLFIVCLVAVEVKDLLYSAILLGGAGVALAAIFYMLQAPDIAITQAVVGVGISTVLYVIAISKTRREE
ncbi:MAG: hypothetical protein APU95_04415 [Hadesarchaea archaeon YNP_N21]|jgi:energy-converting hydrogenase B subunit D|nr:MAG: hypothetical protein APU95_04415 [Hadesarchaea archaeon YNP_N21]